MNDLRPAPAEVQLAHATLVIQRLIKHIEQMHRLRANRDGNWRCKCANWRWDRQFLDKTSERWMRDEAEKLHRGHVQEVVNALLHPEHDYPKVGLK